MKKYLRSHLLLSALCLVAVSCGDNHNSSPFEPKPSDQETGLGLTPESESEVEESVPVEELSEQDQEKIAQDNAQEITWYQTQSNEKAAASDLSRLTEALSRPHSTSEIRHQESSQPEVSAGEEEVSVEVVLQGLKKFRGGNVCMAVYRTEESFLTSDDVVSFCSPVASRVEVSLPSQGVYAISVLHDQDRNNALTTLAFGIPKEGIGFSNNPRIIAGPPNFDSAAIQIDTKAKLLIKMRYFF